MLSYTHLGIGLALSEIIFPENTASQKWWLFSLQQWLFIGASAVPDGPLLVMFIIDKFRGRQPFQEQSKFFVEINHAFHSFLIWLFTTISWPAFLGVYIHLVVDRVSHKDKKYEETDPTWLWPIRRWTLPGGLFEYREGPGELWQLLDLAITYVCTLIFIYLKWFL